MPEFADRIAQNLAEIHGRMAAAAARSGRPADAARLVAVTKYVGLAQTEALVAAGCLVLGESRPQDLWRKAAQLSDPQVEWHLIGHLQRNKVRRTLPLARLIHSADSVRLLETLDSESQMLGIRSSVLLEVNVSQDATKHGFGPAELEPLAEQLAGLQHLEIQGLMAMAAREGDQEESRRNFATLREVRDRMQGACPADMDLAQLSMGMSGDFESAIEEGATLVRIGSALFSGIEG